MHKGNHKVILYSPIQELIVRYMALVSFVFSFETFVVKKVIFN